MHNKVHSYKCETPQGQFTPNRLESGGQIAMVIRLLNLGDNLQIVSDVILLPPECEWVKNQARIQDFGQGGGPAEF